MRSEALDEGIHSFLTPGTLGSSNQDHSDSNSWLKRWRKGDKIFKGKFSAGVTPKIQRPLKRVWIESPHPLFSSDGQNSGDKLEKPKSDAKFGINPFIEITPQWPLKSRAISFNHEDEGPCDIYNSPKSSVTKQFGTPTPNKSFINVSLRVCLSLFLTFLKHPWPDILYRRHLWSCLMTK